MATLLGNHSSHNTMPIYHFKLLVPAAAAGRIIGKGGTTIAQLQKDAGARVKMSKASEFYPGTTERVCLISGPIGGILKINDFFMENFNPSTPMKILVPNSTAGMIIGKGGSYIKQIKDESGAYVQISQKCADFSLPERCVTIVGELDSVRIACALILNKIVEDSAANLSSASPSQSSSSLSPSSFSTTSMGSSASSSYSTSSTSSSSQIILNKLAEESAISAQSPSSSSPLLFSTTHLPCSSSSASTTTSSSSSSQIIETIKLVLQVSGYGEDAVSEISSAMFTLANYGVLGLGLGLF